MKINKKVFLQKCCCYMDCERCPSNDLKYWSLSRFCNDHNDLSFEDCFNKIEELYELMYNFLDNLEDDVDD